MMSLSTTFARLLGASVLASGLGLGAALAQEVTLKLHQMLPAQAPVPAPPISTGGPGRCTGFGHERIGAKSTNRPW